MLLGREVAGGVGGYFGDSEAAESWRWVGMESEHRVKRKAQRYHDFLLKRTGR